MQTADGNSRVISLAHKLTLVLSIFKFVLYWNFLQIQYGVNRFCEYNFFGSFYSSIRSGMFCKIALLKSFGNLQKNTCARVFFLGKVAHQQTCNFIKKRLQHRCFAVNFAKLLKSLCRTPPVSASNFNSTFLTLRPRKTYIYVFPALLVFGYF